VFDVIAACLCVGLPVVAILYFLVFSIQWKRERRLIAKIVASATEVQMEEIARLIESCGTETPTAAFLMATGESTPDKTTLIRLPTNIPQFPWGGRCVTLTNDEGNIPSLSFVESDFEGIVCLGKRYRTVGVPKKKTKTGKSKNIYDIERMLSASPQLVAALKELYPKSPQTLLVYLLRTAPAQIGGPPGWYQDPEVQKCPKCGRYMSLIVQIEDGSAMVYLFGCRAHPDETATLYQLD